VRIITEEKQTLNAVGEANLHTTEINERTGAKLKSKGAAGSMELLGSRLHIQRCFM
jgi:hypothetical protein